MMKSIRVLLLLAVAQILFGSCLLWKESFLSLREGSVYFLILIVGVSGFCAGINYFHTLGQKSHSILRVQKKVSLVYSLLLVVNLLATCLVLTESIQTTSKLQQDLVDLFLPSFFFLLGVDLWIFLPFDKYGQPSQQEENGCDFRFRHNYFLEKSRNNLLRSPLYWSRFFMCAFPLSQIRAKGNFILRTCDSRCFICYLYFYLFLRKARRTVNLA